MVLESLEAMVTFVLNARLEKWNVPKGVKIRNIQRKFRETFGASPVENGNGDIFL